MNESTAVQADRINTARKPKRYAPGRVCRTCGIVISRYNESAYCFAHQPPTYVQPDRW